MSGSLNSVENNSLTGEEMEGVVAHSAHLMSESGWEKNSRAGYINRTKIKFFPDERNHLLTYKKFLENKGWGSDGCPFVLEWPYETIPGMIQDKIVRRWIDELITDIIGVE